MLKQKYKFKNSTVEIDATLAMKSFVLDANKRIQVEYEVYENEADIDDPDIKPIDTQIHVVSSEDDSFEDIQNAIYDLLESQADNSMKEKPEFSDAVIKAKKDIN